MFLTYNIAILTHAQNLGIYTPFCLLDFINKTAQDSGTPARISTRLNSEVYFIRLISIFQS